LPAVRGGIGDRGDYRNRPGFGDRGNRGGIGNDTNIGDRTNIGRIGDTNINNTNITNNINIANDRPYYNDWQHGNWNGNWNHPDGGGYFNGWANGYAQGYNRGYWNGGWGGYWSGGQGGYWGGGSWYTAPVAWGLGAWALGSVMYSSGYTSYSNPYYGGGATTAYYDYSQPITVVNQQPAGATTAAIADTDPATALADASSAALSPEVQEGTSHMNLARAAFRQGDYAVASDEIDRAIAALPSDSALHQFRALVFFATRDYKQAAATLYAVLSAGPGWDWTTLGGMYANSATYTEQLRDLEQYVRDNPSAADARFVAAYQYLTCGHTEAAKKQYQEVLKLQPDDQLSAQLVKLLGGEPATETAEQPPDAEAQPPEAQPPEGATPPADIDATQIVGSWTAKRRDGTTFTLNLSSDSKFKWGFGKGTKKQEFGGKYSVDGAVLVLERTDGAQMPGLVTLADDGFNFKLYGGQPDDPGLDFRQ
jgi:tetratricopeptide (TPR) repeat protein